jgi:uncharacterized protein YodC (DUF2158 family)
MSDPERKIVKLVRTDKKETGGPFPDGAKVHLKSGGPLLTVQTSGPIWTQCTWFDDVGGYCGPEDIKNTSLELYAPKKPRRRTVVKTSGK